MMNIGKMRTPITLQSPVDARTAGKAVQTTYVDVSPDVWGSVEVGETTQSEDRESAKQQQGRNRVLVTIWSYPGLTSKWRLKIGTRILAVTRVNDVGDKGEAMRLECVEVS
jgi:SPP1 family predicted phage head-tail adaptor